MKLYHLFFLFLLVFLPPCSMGAAAPATPGTDKNYGSVEERRIAASVVQERANLQRDREDIALRKKELKTLEAGVDKKLSEMDAKLDELRMLQKKIDTLLAEKSVKEKKRIQDLAKIYDKMSPAQAALALTGLNEQLAADLLANMKVKAAARVLDQISKIKAAELSKTFTTIQLE